MPETRAPSPSVVSWERPAEGVLSVLLRRPPANALGVPIIDGLNAALDHADESGDVKVLLIVSRVDGFFAAGADIKHMGTVDRESFAAYGEALRAPLARLAAADRVSIAAVEGVALGGGLELAMACTTRIGGANARFGLPEVKLGLIPGAGGTQRLPRLVGRGRALDMMLTARQVEAPEAHAIGLIDRLVAAGEAEREALSIAALLARSSQPALQAVLRTVDVAGDLSLTQGILREAKEVQAVFEHGEAREGIAAFIEKRPPSFR